MESIPSNTPKFKSPNILERIAGDGIFSRGQMIEQRVKVQQETKTQVLKDMFFKEHTQPLMSVLSFVYEDACKTVGTRNFDKLFDDQRVRDSVVLVSKTIGVLKSLGGEPVGWSMEKGFEEFDFDWPETQNFNDKYTFFHDRIKLGERAIVVEPGLGVDGKPEIRAKIQKK